MKPLKTLTLLAGIALASTLVLAQDGPPGKPKGNRPPGDRPPGPRPMLMMDHLLPPRVVDQLNLTADQKTKLDELTAAFKKDAEQWRAAHPVTDEDREAMRKARETGDRAALQKFAEQRRELAEKRKGYIDQFRATLTDEQKAKLDKAREEMQARAPRGDHAGKKDKGPKPPPVE